MYYNNLLWRAVYPVCCMCSQFTQTLKPRASSLPLYGCAGQQWNCYPRPWPCPFWSTHVLPEIVNCSVIRMSLACVVQLRRADGGGGESLHASICSWMIESMANDETVPAYCGECIGSRMCVECVPLYIERWWVIWSRARYYYYCYYIREHSYALLMDYMLTRDVLLPLGVYVCFYGQQLTLGGCSMPLHEAAMPSTTGS